MLAMNGNELRDTPGRVLLIWSVAFLPLVVFAWRVHLGPGQFDWTEYPTGLGDDRLYSDVRMIGENDFFSPSLKFSGHTKGLYRRTFKPRSRRDADMMKVAMNSTGEFFVYAEARGAKAQGKTERFFLKSGPDRYIEFGERKYYPPDTGEFSTPPGR